MPKRILAQFAVDHPKLVIWMAALFSLFFLAAFPSLTTDTDPVKMLPQDNPAIVLYQNMKAEFEVYDMVVLGINHPEGKSLFTVDGLTKIHQITKEILEIKDVPAEPTWFSEVFAAMQFLRTKDPNADKVREIMVTEDVMAISEVDDIVRSANGELKVQPLMKNPPQTEAQAQAILQSVNNNPILKGKLASEDGSLVGVFIPLQKGMKDRSFYLGQEMKRIADKHLTQEEYHLAGLPIAENTFGNEMFVQMGVYAPAAGLVIFLLLWFFFKSVKLIVAPMLLAIMTVIWAMGSLIYAGQTIHIMSSMIPIFLMPIAVLNSIHIMSKLHQRLHEFNNRRAAVLAVMEELFNPMLFTSVTTIVGFVSLSSTGIPPVIVFGITIGWGVLLGWLLSMMFIPAYTMLMSEETLEKFGSLASDKKSAVMELIHQFKALAQKAPGAVMLGAVVLMVISIMGIQQIIVNDNPVRWFKEGHALRQADSLMNGKLAGTYMANLIFELPVPQKEGETTETMEEDPFADSDPFADGGMFEAEPQQQMPSLREAEMIAYINKIQDFLLSVRNQEGKPIVGGTTSIVDILRKVGDTALNDDSLPTSREQVSQYIFLFESGDLKRGKDLWKFLTRDGNKAQMWLQLKNGDNNQMNYLRHQLEEFISQPGNQPPTAQLPSGQTVQLKIDWSGLTYINSVWQEEMVSGMRDALVGSFGIVFVMMIFLFRSVSWGFISMLPLSLTILFIYGIIGFSGKYYDMPIAVLSSLTLGLSIDFAIHYLESMRANFKQKGGFLLAFDEVSDGTARAIWRNILVISVGFMPLFFAGLVPYITVGSFFFAIMLVSGVTTLVLLPSIFVKFHAVLLKAK